ncbi:olfactory receptor 1496-like [Gastrophryne carolinensis]
MRMKRLDIFRAAGLSPEGKDLPILPRSLVVAAIQPELPDLTQFQSEAPPEKPTYAQFVPSSYRAAILHQFHDSKTAGHPGIKKTISLLSRQAVSDNNLTFITKVILLGFQGVPAVQKRTLFSIFLVIYCVTICGNLLIITLVSSSKTLHTPMYFFLSQLSVSDILLCSDIVPTLLCCLINNSTTMTFPSCISQLYIFIATEIFECLLLAVMSYDRYLAICDPLRYHSAMKLAFCFQLVLLLWLLSILMILTELLTIKDLWFCGPNIIDHFYCDMEPLLDLSCSETSIVHIEITVFSIPVAIVPFSFIIISYIFIIYNILRLPSISGRQKAFSTCSSHLTVVSIFYGTLFSMYILPTKAQSQTLSKVLSLLYTVVTPLMNPIIYSLRNKDIKRALGKSAHSLQVLFCLR